MKFLLLDEVAENSSFAFEQFDSSHFGNLALDTTANRLAFLMVDSPSLRDLGEGFLDNFF